MTLPPPFRIAFTPAAWEMLTALRHASERAAAARTKRGVAKRSRQEGLYRQVAKAIERLAADPRHPGLRTHEYRSLAHPFDPEAKVFEACAQNRTPGAYRVFWCYGPEADTITIVAITPHP